MDNTLFKQWIGSSSSGYEFDKDMPRFSYNDMLAFGEFVNSQCRLNYVDCCIDDCHYSKAHGKSERVN